MNFLWIAILSIFPLAGNVDDCPAALDAVKRASNVTQEGIYTEYPDERSYVVGKVQEYAQSLSNDLSQCGCADTKEELRAYTEKVTEAAAAKAGEQAEILKLASEQLDKILAKIEACQ